MHLFTSARARRGFIAALASLALVLGVASCSGETSEAKSPTPGEVLAAAKARLDATSGVNLTLSSEDLSPDVAGISGAKGVITHAPAFDGTLTVQLAKQNFEVPVIGVDGIVYAQIPLTTGWSDIDPSEYGAPDPAQLLSPERGFSSLLPVTTGLEKGESVRGGVDNKEVLTTYTGMVPGPAMKRVIPSASGASFDATYLVSDTDELRQAIFTGVFYPDTEPMTYIVDFEDYDTEPEISAP